MSQMSDKMREDFESWIVRKNNLDENTASELLVRHPDNRENYWPDIQPMWMVWQACINFYKINPNKPRLEELIEATPKECWKEWGVE